MSTFTNQQSNSIKSAIHGAIVLPDDPNYDEVRAIWNGMIDRRPAIIVQCADADDVAQALAFAQEQDLEISIRGGGHNIAGNSLCDDGLLIDLSTMKNVRVDVEQRRAYVEPGATLFEVDAATQAHGLATPTGINSTTGIAGLTLGGGFGWITRQFGLTVDNLISADVVTVDGRQLRASLSENPDLFWALRGGGGNFGIVTQFEFQLHPVGPEVLAGLIVFPLAQAKQVLTSLRAFVATAPEELSVWCVLRKAPPLPFLPEEAHGQESAVLALCYAGDIAEGERLIEPLYTFGNPYGTHVGAMPFANWQQAFDPLLTPGARNYWKSHYLTELPDGFIDAAIDAAANLPSPQCEIFIPYIAGVHNRVAPDAMAFGNRDAEWVFNIHGRWDDPADDEACVGWSRALFDATAPYASAGAYVNFMTEEEGDRVAAAYGPNYTRLAELKRRYDPNNVLHMNQNIKP